MIDLDELERLEREATEGPWYPLVGHPYLFANMRGPEPWHHDIVGRFDYHSEKDRALIAALRNAAPELIAMARRYQWGVKNARWLRHEHEAYVAIPVALGADLSCEATRHAAIDAAMQERGR